MSGDLLDAVFALLVESALKGTVLLILVGVLLCLVRHLSSAQRHLSWLAALAGFAVLPLAMLLLPAIKVASIPSWTMVTSAPATNDRMLILADFAQLPKIGEQKNHRPPAWISPTTEKNKQTIEARAESKPLHAEGEYSPAWIAALTWPNLKRLMIGLWLAGLLLLVIRLILGCWSLRRLRRATICMRKGRAHDMLHELIANLRIQRRITLLQSGERLIPMTWGFWRPIVLLPADCEQWSDEQMRMVLLHELAHVQRWDCLTQFLAQLTQAVYWFHPLVWWATASMRLEQERACDDRVVQAGLPPSDYAEHLLAVSAKRLPGALINSLALGMSRAAQLRNRVVNLLDSSYRRHAMNRKFVIGTLALALVMFVPLALVKGGARQAAENPQVAPVAGAQPPGQTKSRPDIEQVLRIIKDAYVKPVDADKTIENAIKGMLNGLDDPHSSYFTPGDMKKFKEQMEQQIVGIGAQIQLKDGQLSVITPLPGSPALKAGLRPDDVILSIDGKTTKGESLIDSVNKLRGKHGTAVRVDVLRPDGSKAQLKITRGVVKMASIKGFARDKNQNWSYLLDGKNKIGYVQIKQFSPSTEKELEQVLRGLNKAGMKGLILDLRFCPGGLLQQAVAVCDLFLKKGTILTIGKGEQQIKKFEAKQAAAAPDVPLIVLVNDKTASAAEIVAGSLKDNKRAKIVGSRTYGKGSVQTLVALKNGGAVRLTTSYHYMPSGRNIQKKAGEKTWGIDPHDGYYVPLSPEQSRTLLTTMAKRDVLRPKAGGAPKSVSPKQLAKAYADPQLAAALRAIQSKLTKGNFAKVGGSLKDQQKDANNREQLQARRLELQRQLQELNRELEGLKSGSAKRE